MDDLHEKEGAWEQLLERAAGLVESDPLSALDWARSVAKEIAQQRGEQPQPAGELGMLAQRAQQLIVVSQQASEQFLDASAERERHWHLRELRAIAVPVSKLRQPWPAPAQRP